MYLCEKISDFLCKRLQEKRRDCHVYLNCKCAAVLRPYAGRGVRSTPVLVLSPVKIANAIFTAPRGGMGISASLLRSISSFNLRLRAGLRPLPTAVLISRDSLH